METLDLQALTGLIRLIYTSRWAGRPPELDQAVTSIIHASIRNNRLCDVTGILLIHEGWFLQALEGPAVGVRETYGRICEDARHREITLLEAGPATGRLFRDWNMSARLVARRHSPLLGELGMGDGFRPTALTGEQARQLLLEVGMAHAA